MAVRTVELHGGPLNGRRVDAMPRRAHALRASWDDEAEWYYRRAGGWVWEMPEGVEDVGHHAGAFDVTVINRAPTVPLQA